MISFPNLLNHEDNFGQINNIKIEFSIEHIFLCTMYVYQAFNLTHFNVFAGIPEISNSLKYYLLLFGAVGLA